MNIRNRHLAVLLAVALILAACQVPRLSPLLEQQATEAPAQNPLDEKSIVAAAVATITAGQDELQPALATPVPVAAQAASVGLDLQQSLIELYESVNPSVVHIFVRRGGFFLGTGSGFLLDEEGHIVTNNHVVSGGTEFDVSFYDGTISASADIVGRDADSDLAVIKVDNVPTGVSPIPLGDSEEVRVGQFVVAIGNPFGEAGSMTVGVVSAVGRTIESQRETESGASYSLPEVIQTDAAINPGNSGGPLLDLAGNVVGVNSSILSTTGSNTGVGFSIPVNAVRRIAPVLIENGRYVYPYMGITMRTVDNLVQEDLDLPVADGAWVVEVESDSPAARAGLIGREGPGSDVIVAVDGVSVETTEDLISYLVFNTEVGQTIDLTVLRQGDSVVVPLTLGPRP